jgi:hypothetical protein
VRALLDKSQRRCFDLDLGSPWFKALEYSYALVPTLR